MVMVRVALVDAAFVQLAALHWPDWPAAMEPEMLTVWAAPEPVLGTPASVRL